MRAADFASLAADATVRRRRPPHMNDTRRLNHRASLLIVAFAALLFIGCPRGDLRGSAVASPDGGTYLVIDDDNGGACGAIMVDGKVWPRPLDQPHPISPGVHHIQCGEDDGLTQFTVEAGTVFHFAYWGP